ncbi:MAG: FimV/HubP family polar landmark protein [Cocleimonas sp.]
MPLLISAILISLSFSSVGFSEENSPYGPTKKGESLWLVAKKLNNKSVSIQQLTLAIYQLNPKSFTSGNINLLKVGTVLSIPNNETITQTSSKEAIKKLGQQKHQLKLLQVSASQLKSAKSNVKKQKTKVRKFQKKLAKYKHKSRQWNKTYRQLVSSKRSHNKAKRKVVSLRKLLREKAQLKNKQQLAKLKKPAEKITTTPITRKKESTTTEPTEANVAVVATIKKRPATKKSKINKVDKRLGSIQDSLKVIGKSNTLLMTKIIKLSSLNERVQILEKELGNNDKLVMDLKQSLETAQAMMKQQSQNNANLFKNFEQFEVALNKPQPAAVVIAKSNQSAETVPSENQKTEARALSTKESIKDSVEDTLVTSTSKKTEPIAKTDVREQLMNQLLSEPKQVPVDVVKEVDEIQSQIVVESEVVKEEMTDVIVDTETLSMSLSETLVEPQTVENIVVPVESQVIEDIITPVESEAVTVNTSDTEGTLLTNNSYDAYTKNDLKSEPLLSSAKDTTQPPISNSTETAKATLTGLSSGKLSMLPTKPSDAAINHQRKLKSSANESGNYWINLLKEQWILAGSTLNALILLFVLFKLFSNRKKQQEDAESSSGAYISWQDREKPRHA